MGRARPVIWTREARDCLDEILAYIASDSPAAAGKILEVILGMADSLSLFWSRGRIVPELRDDAIREVFVYRYRLIYQVHSKEIRVLAIIHGAMDFERWLRSSR